MEVINYMEPFKEMVNPVKLRIMFNKKTPSGYEITEEEYYSTNVKRVETKKIIGINRFSRMSTFYQGYKEYMINLDREINRNFYSTEKNINLKRADQQIVLLCKHGKEHFIETTKKPLNNDNIHFEYYPDIDRYFVDSDGSHRTFIAKLAGIEYIYGIVHTHFKL
ncbi:hypothetical protein A5819_000960 [Enterococcus sp. 7E2_DIV0204]|uniref:hypothetical protein n=1 Tax=unclassified Enterococcus TaxID=2608891 RepID=UPI000A348D23|nr:MULTISPECIES: hypothetical protein [unclassified Enterococcus]OTN88479.1 hypothetical protein A5819_000960 [Enterococcus sp. 7E2_DIV0204]OTP50948.1 hypothetical protein A5884_000134 [Enterococcus sp. 7D2_DIV0200]